jgi:2'-5' RNA ligase
MHSALNRLRQPEACHGFTIASELRDFPGWHRGRPDFAVWAIAVEDAVVDERLCKLRETLDGRLLPAYERQPHVTVLVCGFPVIVSRRLDDFDTAHLAAQVDALGRWRPGPFDLTIGDAFTFASAAFLSIHDDAGSLRRLRSILQGAAPGSDSTPYVPHLTAGLYAGSWPLREVHARLRSIPSSRALALRVRSLDWMCYRSHRIAGPLRRLLRVDLASGQVHVPDVGLLQATFDAAQAHPATP